MVLVVWVQQVGEEFMISKQFVDKYVKEAGDSKFLGVLIEDLSRDELIACLLYMCKVEKIQIKESSR